MHRGDRTERRDDAPRSDRAPSAGAEARFARSREVRSDAAALRAESRQARRQARATHEQTSAILESVRAIAAEVLQADDHAVAAVDAEFTTTESGTTGVEVTVQLADPAHAERVAAALADRFGGPTPPDAITVR